MGRDGEVLSVTVSEPRFTPVEKAKLMRSRFEDTRPRGSHGLPLSDATDATKEWEVGLPTRDFAQQALDRTRAEYEKNYGDSAENGSLIWTVRPK